MRTVQNSLLIYDIDRHKWLFTVALPRFIFIGHCSMATLSDLAFCCQNVHFFASFLGDVCLSFSQSLYTMAQKRDISYSFMYFLGILLYSLLNASHVTFQAK